MRKNNTTKFYVGSPVTNALLVRLPNAIKEKGASIIYELRQRPFADEVAYFDTKEEAEFAVENQTKDDESVLVIGYYEQLMPY